MKYLLCYFYKPARPPEAWGYSSAVLELERLTAERVRDAERTIARETDAAEVIILNALRLDE